MNGFAITSIFYFRGSLGFLLTLRRNVIADGDEEEVDGRGYYGRDDDIGGGGVRAGRCGAGGTRDG